MIINANDGTVQTADLSVETGKDVWVIVTDAENAAVTYEEPTVEAASQETETTAPETTEAAPEAPAEKSGSNTGVVAGIIVVVAVIGGGAAVAAKKKKK